MEELFTLKNLAGFATLSLMEIVLGIDNLVFLSILTDRLPAAQRPKARRLGLGLALFGRLALLFSISWVMSLEKELFHLVGHGFSGKDMILLLGGLFLMGKASHEIYLKVEAHEDHDSGKAAASAFASVIVQIILMDMIFSLDSVITAVGMINHIPVIVAAMVVAMTIMILAADSTGAFIARHPSVKILALSFLILIGVMLVAEGTGQHFNRGYVYFAMAFSLSVELVNMRFRARTSRKAQPAG